MDWLEQVGWIGVDCFFVLSGFLIGGLLFSEIQKTGLFDWKRFLVRRMFKIWPQYYSYLLFFFVLGVTCFGYSAASRLHMMLFALVNFQNYSHRWDSHIWSLAVEEHFYLLLPLALLLALAFYGKRCQNGIPYFLIAGTVVLIGVLVGRLLVGRMPFDNKWHYFGTHARLDSLCFGVLIAYASVFHRSFWTELLRRPFLFCWVAASLLLPVLAFAPDKKYWFTHTWGYSFLYLGFGCLLISAMGFSQAPAVDTWLQGRVAKALAWVGLNSYGIYLWHQDVVINPLELWIYPQAKAWPKSAEFCVEFLLVVGGSVLVGALSTACIERPMLSLRDRFWPARERVAVAGR